MIIKLKRICICLFILLCFYFTNVFAIELKEYSLDEIPYLKKSVNRDIEQNDSLLIKKLGISGSYDLREYYDRVKSQGETSLCWAYAATSSIEQNILLNLKEDIIVSPEKLDKEISNIYNKEETEAGNAILALDYYTSGGEFYDDENEIINKEIESYIFFDNIYKKKTNNIIQYYSDSEYEYTEDQVNDIRNLVKNHIVKYGGVATMMHAESLMDFIDDSNYAYNCNNSIKKVDHQVLIVGWDDNYSKENFKESVRPINNGAYLVLSSWGEEFGDKGCLWISYEDFFIENTMIGIKEIVEKNHNNIYQHDELGISSVISYPDDLYCANVFERDISKIESLTQIGIANLLEQEYEIYVNSIDGELNDSKFEKVKTVTLPAGYNTITLDSPITLEGSMFVIKLKCLKNSDGYSYIGVEGDDYFWNTSEIKNNESFLSNGVKCFDLKNENFTNLCIKGFTKENKDNYKISEEGYIFKILPDTTIEELVNNLSNNNDSIKIYDSSNELMASYNNSQIEYNNNYNKKI